jgi:hypothetical protein
VTAIRTASPLERFAGRLLALCLHPITAWRLTTVVERTLLVCSYTAAGYVAALACLLLRAR